MKRNNVWNRIFHKKELSEQKKKYELAKKLVGFGPEILQSIEKAQCLSELLDAHKLAWSRGYQNKNLGPCGYGMFRTSDISKMTADEVYLGNIYGLWMDTLRYWESHEPSPMGCGFPEGTTDSSLIMRQYRNHLQSNIWNIIQKSKDYISEYEM